MQWSGRSMPTASHVKAERKAEGWALEDSDHLFHFHHHLYTVNLPTAERNTRRLRDCLFSKYTSLTQSLPGPNTSTKAGFTGSHFLVPWKRRWSTKEIISESNLQSVSEKLVELGDLGGDGEVDRPVANLDDESTQNVGVDLVGDLELLAGADVLRLGDGSLKTVEGLAVELLEGEGASGQRIEPMHRGA